MPNNEAEQWFERYLADHGYDYEYEPDLGVDTRPDFLVGRNGVEVICEVKAFEQQPALERRLEGLNQPMMVSSDEVYGPMRGAVREAAKQLKPLADSPRPLVIVLANPMGFHVHLSLESLTAAMFGNPGYVGDFNPDEGLVGGLEFQYGRDGRLRNDHPYISAVAILEERSLARELYEAWLARWRQARPRLASEEEIGAEFVAAQEAWEASEEGANEPEGNAYFIELLTTGSPQASPVPEDVFNGPRDTRRDVERVVQGA